MEHILNGLMKSIAKKYLEERENTIKNTINNKKKKELEDFYKEKEREKEEILKMVKQCKIDCKLGSVKAFCLDLCDGTPKCKTDHFGKLDIVRRYTWSFFISSISNGTPLREINGDIRKLWPNCPVLFEDMITYMKCPKKENTNTNTNTNTNIVYTSDIESCYICTSSPDGEVCLRIIDMESRL